MTTVVNNVYDFFSYREKILKERAIKALQEKPISEERRKEIEDAKRKFLDIYRNGYNPEIHGKIT